MKKKILPILMSLIMAFIMMPAAAGSVYADDQEAVTEGTISEETEQLSGGKLSLTVYYLTGPTHQQFTAGDTIKYMATVENSGDARVEDIAVTDELTVQKTRIANLKPGESTWDLFSYVVTEDDVKAGKVTDTFTAAGKDIVSLEIVTSDPVEITVPVGQGKDPEEEKTDISSWNVEGIEDLTYTGKVLKQSSILVSKDGEYADIKTGYKNNVNAGTATVTITGTGDYRGTIVKKFRITRAANRITNVSASYSKSLAYSAKAQKVIALRPSAKEDPVFTYRITSIKRGAEKKASGFTVSRTGVVKTAKKLAKGSYTVTVKISAAKTADYKAANKTVALKVRIK